MELVACEFWFYLFFRAFLGSRRVCGEEVLGDDCVSALLGHGEVILSGMMSQLRMEMLSQWLNVQGVTFVIYLLRTKQHA